MFSSRKRYKILSWDFDALRGIATDGTKFEGEPIEFVVLSRDLSPEYNGSLDEGEIISAEEAPDRSLFDIVIEEGPRAWRPVQSNFSRVMTDNEVEDIVNKGLSVDAQIGSIVDLQTGEVIGEVQEPISAEYHVAGPPPISHVGSVFRYIEGGAPNKSSFPIPDVIRFDQDFLNSFEVHEQLYKLEERVKKLERIIEGRVDDHK